MRLISCLFVTALAAWTPGPQGAPAAAPAQPRPAATIRAAESSLIGVIERFEDAGKRLVLQTKEGRVSFVLATDAVVRLGARTLTHSEIAAHRGRKAKVRFTQSDGRRTAHWVVISSDPPRTAA